MNKQNEGVNLLVSIGKDELDNDLIIDISKLSHLLIGGISGSGKSNLLHRIITTLSSSISPNDLKFILVDPKKVELNLYNGISHLLTPVITDYRKSILALKWACKEMDRRLETFQFNKVRNIESYRNEYPQEDSMPYIVIVIDDISFIAGTYPKEIESIINSLTQTGHLVGIHLVISTSRFTNKVITESIRVGIKSRIAFKVPTISDSKKVLGTSGAERLQPEGEILFQSVNMRYPVCVKLSEISEKEIKDSVKVAKSKYAKKDSEELPMGDKVESILYVNADDSEDELYEQAKQVVTEFGKASTSYLQRKMGIGYAHAACLIDLLEDRGVIDSGKGSAPRNVIAK
jgi:S-DNA-T family DNA segregation ATPase FtsK/SpoIIIE